MQISIIIVNYNTPQLVNQAIRSVYRYMESLDFEIIVIDNASTKGSIETALKDFPEVHLIKSAVNIGFGRANNLGFERAQGNYIFLLNSDAYLIDDIAVPLMVAYLNAHSDVGIVGPNFVKADGSKNYAYGHLLGMRKQFHDMGIWKIANDRLKDYATFKECDVTLPTQVGYLGAAGILLKTEVVKKIGLFDPKFFLYFEDMELGWRFKKAGFHSVLVPEATIVHLGGASSATTKHFVLKKTQESKKYYLRKTQGIFVYSLIMLVDKCLILFRGFVKKV